jgi:hypothetical protein
MAAWYDRSMHVHTLAVETSGEKNTKENTNRTARCCALERVRGGDQCQLTVAGTHRLRFCCDWSVELAMAGG